MTTVSVKPPEIPHLDGIIERHRGTPGALLGILEEAQEAQEHRYLSEEVLRRISRRTGIPLSQIFGVATFYSFFHLKPQGLHSLAVCRGTACHTRGSAGILDEALRSLGLEEAGSDEGERTTADGSCSVLTVACFGQCALAPVVMADGVIRSSMTVSKTAALLRSLVKRARP